jgi:hypothetical protein
MGRAMTSIGAGETARTTALIAVAALTGCGGAPIVPGAEPGIQPSSVAFSRHTVAHTDAGPAFAAAADLDGDGRPELVVSMLGQASGFPPRLGQGRVVIYSQGASLDDWSARDLVSAVRFPNRPTITDVDGDGDLDVIVPSGFLVCPLFGLGDCGALRWYEQADGDFCAHTLVENSALFYHGVVLADLDGDGRKDLVTVGESRVMGAPDRAQAELYRGTDDDDRFAHAPIVLAEGLGSFVNVADLDGDGDLDLASAEFFVAAESFAWLEQRPDQRFAKHLIDGASGPSLQLSLVDNLFGDGRRVGVGTNHVNTQATTPDPEPSMVMALWPGTNPAAPWNHVAISDGIVSAPTGPGGGLAQAPGIFGVGDIDDDGDLDVLVAGDGDPHVYWLEQLRPGRFATHVLEDDLTQAGGVLVVDLDGDGKSELVVTGYDANVVYVYKKENP